MEQLAPAARLLPQVFNIPKSAELVLTLVMESAAPPVLVAITVCGSPEVPTYWPGNLMLEGDNVSAGAGVVVPVKSIA
jgi:hypothetical protein